MSERHETSVDQHDPAVVEDQRGEYVVAGYATLRAVEDDDLFADINEHDGKTWDNDVFEMFFKPAKNKSGYFEFHVSAAGTVMDVFLPKRGDGKFKEHLADGDGRRTACL